MAQKTSFKIRRKDSERVVSDVVIEKEGLKIGGKQSDVDLFLNHPAVSPVHAIIHKEDGRLWIEDTMDFNATLVNGSCISKAPLLEGDEVQIGPFSLRVGFEPHAVLITVERSLKAAVRATVGAAAQPAGSAPRAGTEEEKKDALDIIWDARKREAGKVGVSTPLYPMKLYAMGKARFNWSATGDLEPKRRKVFLARAIAAVALVSLAAVFICREVYSPGQLAFAHSSSAAPTRGIAHDSVSSCGDCHQVFGNLSRACTDCHKAPTSTEARGFDPRLSDKHEEANIGCVGCHSEHNGAAFPIKAVDARSCMSCHNDDYKFRGKVVGAPHKGSLVEPTGSSDKPTVGYIRGRDGVLKWKDTTDEDAKLRFHAEHPYGLQQCLYCHKGPPFTLEWKESPRAACKACHAVSLDADVPEVIGPNCGTCHAQHGQHKGLRASLNRLSNEEIKKVVEQVRAKGLYSLEDKTKDFVQSQIGGASVERQGSANLKDWNFTSRLGFAPFHFWTAPVGILALGGAALVLFGNARRRKVLRAERALRRIARRSDIGRESDEADKLRRPPLVYTFPRIDPTRCIGCYRCIEVCPHDVLTMSKEKIAAPTAWTQCMDDAACQVECPTQACIVANSAKSPPVRKGPERNSDTYETGVNGLHIIGDAARIPLIRYAIVEGAKVIDEIDRQLKETPGDAAAQYDVAIIGAGPAGLSATLRAAEIGLKYVTIERNEALSTLDGYPARKNVNLTVYGDEPGGLLPLPASHGQRLKEDILAYWKRLIDSRKLKINQHEECTDMKEAAGSLTVFTEKGERCEPATYTSRRVVLAIGNSGAPSLSVYGMDSKIRIERPPTKCQNCGASLRPQQGCCGCCDIEIDPSATEIYFDDKAKFGLPVSESYDRKKCVVVGGGNSAVEAAVKLTGFDPSSDEGFTRNNEVTLVVRSDLAPDLTFANKMNLYECRDNGRIKVLLQTEIKEITCDEVVLKNKDGKETGRIPNDYVFFCIGAQWPEGFLTKLGVIKPKDPAERAC